VSFIVFRKYYQRPDISGNGILSGFWGLYRLSNSHLQEVIKGIPENRLLVETDCPYSRRKNTAGKEMSRPNIIYTVEKMAEILGTTAEQVGKQTTENAMRLF